MRTSSRTLLLACGFLLVVATVGAGQQSEASPRTVLESAAAKGSPTAQYALGAAAEAEGRFPDAVAWYRQAANHGYGPAQFTLGQLLETGQGIAPDSAKALEWYRQAATQGFSPAIERLRVLDPSFVPPPAKDESTSQRPAPSDHPDLDRPLALRGIQGLRSSSVHKPATASWMLTAA